MREQGAARLGPLAQLSCSVLSPAGPVAGSTLSAPTWAATSGAARDPPALPVASPADGPRSGPAGLAGAGVRRWVYQNQTMPAMVRMVATYMLNRSPRKCSDGSTRSDSSKIRNAEYPVTYSANRPGGLIERWWPSQTRRAASARSKISSYRNVGWNVRKARYPGGRYAAGISSPQGSVVGPPNSSLR